MFICIQIDRDRIVFTRYYYIYKHIQADSCSIFFLENYKRFEKCLFLELVARYTNLQMFSVVLDIHNFFTCQTGTDSIFNKQ